MLCGYSLCPSIYQRALNLVDAVAQKWKVTVIIFLPKHQGLAGLFQDHREASDRECLVSVMNCSFHYRSMSVCVYKITNGHCLSWLKTLCGDFMLPQPFTTVFWEESDSHIALLKPPKSWDGQICQSVLYKCIAVPLVVLGSQMFRESQSRIIKSEVIIRKRSHWWLNPLEVYSEVSQINFSATYSQVNEYSSSQPTRLLCFPSIT